MNGSWILIGSVPGPDRAAFCSFRPKGAMVPDQTRLKRTEAGIHAFLQHIGDEAAAGKDEDFGQMPLLHQPGGGGSGGEVEPYHLVEGMLGQDENELALADKRDGDGHSLASLQRETCMDHPIRTVNCPIPSKSRPRLLPASCPPASESVRRIAGQAAKGRDEVADVAEAGLAGNDSQRLARTAEQQLAGSADAQPHEVGVGRQAEQAAEQRIEPAAGEACGCGQVPEPDRRLVKIGLQPGQQRLELAQPLRHAGGFVGAGVRAQRQQEPVRLLGRFQPERIGLAFQQLQAVQQQAVQRRSRLPAVERRTGQRQRRHEARQLGSGKGQVGRLPDAASAAVAMGFSRRQEQSAAGRQRLRMAVPGDASFAGERLQPVVDRVAVSAMERLLVRVEADALQLDRQRPVLQLDGNDPAMSGDVHRYGPPKLNVVPYSYICRP
ncbi:hypothetical protein BN871_CI_00080 [Paenibacillus sp. P22]|nr:hypothetical protein BN871_CI_00080 [Paenibacillus sp. P22]